MLTVNTIEASPAAVRLGSRTFPWPGSYAEVSVAYRAAVDATGATSSGETGPRAPDCDVIDGGGRVIAVVSYNGKVWGGDRDKWLSGGAELIFNPYA